MKKLLTISIIIILLIIGVAFIINGTIKQKANNIYIYKNQGFSTETMQYEYEEIMLNKKEKNEIKKLYSKIQKREEYIEQAYIGELMVKSDDGSGFLYDNDKYALYYDDIENRDGGKSIRISDSFVEFLSNYL